MGQVAHSVSELIAGVSTFFWLLPGDIVTCGSPTNRSPGLRTETLLPWMFRGLDPSTSPLMIRSAVTASVLHELGIHP